MQSFYGYIRVSTLRQGEQGVSLQQQREAITQYAARNGLKIIAWFEERETAAHHGRPVFSRMLRLLQAGKASGLIVHKIDRSARNLKDWADLGELIDAGVAVHFANETLDLNSRGGRLSADIQAVVAADYIRNLREETRKGFYGRLKQGLYPMPAVVGYLDQGKGKPKVPDPVQSPLVRKAYELYATGNYNLDRLLEEMHARGLRNRKGKRLSKNGLSRILNNPFYTGRIHIRKTGESFAGIHEAIVPASLYSQVQEVLHGKVHRKVKKHEFLFRQLFTCKLCGHSMVGERQKDIIYYRCHSRGCLTKCIPEQKIEAVIARAFRPLEFTQEEKDYFRSRLSNMRSDWGKERETVIRTLELQLSQVQARENRLTDAYLEGALDRQSLEERKTTLLAERRHLTDKLVAIRANPASMPDELAAILE
ncbi:MAG TPA: recombinase family protein, partial [Nitrososphaera sp.]|nr:recombinase family protein [Nitrososphaera sp.]